MDIPYTSPDEDPFHVDTRTITRARSVMLDKWIHDQSSSSTTPYSSPSRAMSNPYLAYPDLPRAATLTFTVPKDDAASVLSYDLVDDDDIPADQITPQPPKSPVRTPKSSRHSITPSFRNLTIAFRASPQKSSSSSSPTVNRTFSRIFPRTPRSSTEPPAEPTLTPTAHARSSSLSTLALATPRSNKRLSTSTTASRWRPSVLGHFYQPTASDSSIHVSDTHTPSRPSISSRDTHSSSNVTTTSHPHTSVDTHVTSITSPSKLSLFESIRIRANRASTSFSSLPAASSTSLTRHSRSGSNDATSPASDIGHAPKSFHFSRPPLAPKSGSILDNIDDEEDLDPPATLRPFKKATRPSIPTSSLPRVKFGSIGSIGSRSLRKRKKLVISGIAAAESRKLDGIKRWCESFGEIRSMSRVPNGDLHIDFRDPEVADTVCRVRAKVYIAGVGSVQLSWVHANKKA